MPIIPMQVGLVLKPGPQEPWTPYRIAAAFYEAGIPREAISLYPGEADIGAAVLESCNRSLIFGGTATVERYRGNPRVQAHGPGFSKILIGDDEVDHWETIPRSHGRKRFDQQRPGLHQLFGHLGQPPHARDRGCPGASGWPKSSPCRRNIRRLNWQRSRCPELRTPFPTRLMSICSSPVLTDLTSKYRDGGRVSKQGRADYLLPTVVHCASPEAAIAKKEYMFPFVTVVECPESKNDRSCGSDTGVHRDHRQRASFVDS